jgi:hypothetical protein
VIAFAAGILVGLVGAWCWFLSRVSVVVQRHLTARPDETVDIADDLFWALVPGPFGRWIDRQALRIIKRDERS